MSIYIPDGSRSVKEIRSSNLNKKNHNRHFRKDSNEFFDQYGMLKEEYQKIQKNEKSNLTYQELKKKIKTDICPPPIESFSIHKIIDKCTNGNFVYNFYSNETL